MQWMKVIWVGRLDESDGHVVLTPHGTVTGRTVRRLGGHLRVQPDLVGKLQSRFQDPALAQVELLKVHPASLPIWLARETDTDQFAEEQDRAAQKEQVEGIVNERAEAEITKPCQAPEDENDKDVKRQWPGEPQTTIVEDVVGDETGDIMMTQLDWLMRKQERKDIRQENSKRISGVEQWWQWPERVNVRMHSHPPMPSRRAKKNTKKSTL